MTDRADKTGPTAGEVVRFAMLMSHYRHNLNWTERRMPEAQTILSKFFRLAKKTEGRPPIEVLQAICDDLNTVRCIALMHGYAKRQEGEKLYASLRLLGFFGGDSDPASELKTMPLDHAAELAVLETRNMQ